MSSNKGEYKKLKPVAKLAAKTIAVSAADSASEKNLKTNKAKNVRRTNVESNVSNENTNVMPTTKPAISTNFTQLLQPIAVRLQIIKDKKFSFSKAQVPLRMAQMEADFFKTNFVEEEYLASAMLNCTICSKHIGTSMLAQFDRYIHPELNVLICRSCFVHHNIIKQECQEKMCIWCSKSGNMYCCSKCTLVFCEECIRRNLGNTHYKQMENAEIWRCFKCVPTQLAKFHITCHVLHKFITKQLVEFFCSSNGYDEKLRSLISDISTCCKNNGKRKTDAAEIESICSTKQLKVTDIKIIHPREVLDFPDDNPPSPIEIKDEDISHIKKEESTPITIRTVPISSLLESKKPPEIEIPKRANSLQIVLPKASQKGPPPLSLQMPKLIHFQKKCAHSTAPANRMPTLPLSITTNGKVTRKIVEFKSPVKLATQVQVNMKGVPPQIQKLVKNQKESVQYATLNKLSVQEPIQSTSKLIKVAIPPKLNKQPLLEKVDNSTRTSFATISLKKSVSEKTHHQQVRQSQRLLKRTEVPWLLDAIIESKNCAKELLANADITEGFSDKLLSPADINEIYCMMLEDIKECSKKLHATKLKMQEFYIQYFKSIHENTLKQTKVPPVEEKTDAVVVLNGTLKSQPENSETFESTSSSQGKDNEPSEDLYVEYDPSDIILPGMKQPAGPIVDLSEGDIIHKPISKMSPSTVSQTISNSSLIGLGNTSLKPLKMKSRLSNINLLRRNHVKLPSKPISVDPKPDLFAINNNYQVNVNKNSNSLPDVQASEPIVEPVSKPIHKQKSEPINEQIYVPIERDPLALSDCDNADSDIDDTAINSYPKVLFFPVPLKITLPIGD